MSYSCVNHAPLMMASPNPVHLETLDCLMGDEAWGSLDISEVSIIIYLVTANYDAIYDCGLEDYVAKVAAKFSAHDCLKLWVSDWEECKDEYEE